MNWEQGRAGELDLKVVDAGLYYLLDEEKNILLSLEEDYVPTSLLPGNDSDYLKLKIDENGFITNRKKNPSIDDFIIND